jgi:phosphotriesterase-related protein
MQGKVMTVLGAIEPQDLGITLTHEHLLVDLRVWSQEPRDEEKKALIHAPVDLSTLGAIRRDPLLNRDNCVLDDVPLAIAELRQFKAAGGSSVVDCTNNGLHRAPLALKEISQATGVQIIMGSGYYIGRSHPQDLHTRSVDAITDEIVNDLTAGVSDTGVRAGLIGEIGTSYKIRETEKKVLQAAARAQQRTGAPISVHLLPWRKNGIEALDILEGEGANLHQVILSHLSPTCDDIQYHTTLARRGAYVEYDFFGMEFYVDTVGQYMGSDYYSITAIKRLIDEGLLERLLLSHDTGMKIQLTRYGGWGYAHLLKHVAPMLQRRGFGESEITTLLVENPRRVLTWGAVAS